MKKDTNNLSNEFHAGRFLQESLQESGHGVAWLAAKTGRTVPEIDALFAMPNMDVELFVRLGIPMGAFFFNRVHREIFPE